MEKNEKRQSLQLGDSYLNLIVGIIVVLAVAALVIGLIRNKNVQTGEKPQEPEQTESETQAGLPTKHTVAAGEDLWKISEKYYKTGYNWVDIAKENNLKNPDGIEAGMELTIPNVAPKAAPTSTPVQVTAQPSPQPTTGTSAQAVQEAISGTSYTVVAGDYLWSIALRAYGDGYKWVEIARTNKLANPNLIYPGNTLTIPR